MNTNVVSFGRSLSTKSHFRPPPHHSGRLTTLAYPLLQNLRVSAGHLLVQNLSRAQKHGFHSRTLQQSDLILTIQREEACRGASRHSLRAAKDTQDVHLLNELEFL